MGRNKESCNTGNCETDLNACAVSTGLLRYFHYASPYRLLQTSDRCSWTRSAVRDGLSADAPHAHRIPTERRLRIRARPDHCGKSHL